MTDEQTHDAIEQFKNIDRGSDYYDEHQELIDTLGDVLKHVSEDGETHNPPKTVSDEGHFESLSTDEARIGESQKYTWRDRGRRRNRP